MKLPNAESASVDIRKLRDYCLNSDHPRGKHKARLFSSILGLTDKDAEKLRSALLRAACNYEAIETMQDQYGKRYVVDFSMKTEKGQAIIRSLWIILVGEDFARLASCYIL